MTNDGNQACNGAITVGALALAALESAWGADLEPAWGADLGLTQRPGVLATADYFPHLTGPAVIYFNDADAGRGGWHRMDPVLRWGLSPTQGAPAAPAALSWWGGGTYFAGMISMALMVGFSLWVVKRMSSWPSVTVTGTLST